jgi:hypothetical protein
MSVERGSLVCSQHKSMLANADEDRDRLALTRIRLVDPPLSRKSSVQRTRQVADEELVDFALCFANPLGVADGRLPAARGETLMLARCQPWAEDGRRRQGRRVADRLALVPDRIAAGCYRLWM